MFDWLLNIRGSGAATFLKIHSQNFSKSFILLNVLCLRFQEQYFLNRFGG